MRNIIFHYHLFKNAGTSLDALLKENFPNQWTTREFSADPVLNQKEVIDWIVTSPEMVCFSTHTAKLPPPVIEGVNVLPIIFIRHPIDRIASVYHFEKNQNNGGKWPTIAKNRSFREYLEERLIVFGDRQCRNFHVHQLSRMYPTHLGTEYERAVKAVEALPFLGVVELYADSVNQLGNWIGNFFTDFKTSVHHKNATRNTSIGIEDRLVAIMEDLGKDFYNHLIEINKEDINLYTKILSINRKHIENLEKF